ncbi:MAG: type II toxin-antitoxin system RelE/ParE family toxin [Cyclobacteriaceae bacterium]
MSEVTVSFTPEFRRNIRRLARKYRNIRADIQPVITELTQGGTPGNQIQGTGYTVFKVRVKNSDAQRGKSGGYRIIYYLQTSSDVILITIYSKTEQGDISAEQIRRIISGQ